MEQVLPGGTRVGCVAQSACPPFWFLLEACISPCLHPRGHDGKGLFFFSHAGLGFEPQICWIGTLSPSCSPDFKMVSLQFSFVVFVGIEVLTNAIQILNH